jgi:hypothetical protein
MQAPNYLRAVLIMIAFATPVAIHAQSLSEEERTAAIQSIARHIAGNYVFPEQGGQIASHIQQANHRGEFNNARNWKEFDEQVTASIQAFSKDPHLYVQYDPQQAETLSTSGARTADRMYVSDGEPGESATVVADSRILDGNIGYVKLSSLNINKETLPAIYKTIKAVENTDALIVDLRDNKGGGSELGAVFESFFVPSSTPLLEVTSRTGDVRKLNAVDWLKVKRYEKPLYVLVNRNTASAAEAFAFSLQQIGRAKVAGETTSGAAYLNEWYPVGSHSYVSVSTSAPNFPGTDRSWNGTGVRPNIKVKNTDPLALLTAKINAGKS